MSRCVLTVQSLDAPHVVLAHVPLARVGGVGVHQGLRVSGVPQAEGVADLMSCYLDQVVQPDTCRDMVTPEHLDLNLRPTEPADLQFYPESS